MSSKTTLLSRRQSLLAITCAAAFGPLAFAGCGGGGGASGGNSGSSRRVSGKANLPANLVPRATQLRLFTAVDDTSLAVDGKFTVNTLADIATIGTLMDGDKPVLIGFLGANAPSNVLDSGSCATALLFIALGGQQIAPDQRQAFVSLIAGNTVTASLAQTIAERLAADPYALYNQDPQVAVALNAAVQALIPNAGKAIRPSSASAVTPLEAAAATRGILQAIPVGAVNPSHSLSRAASLQSRAAGTRATDVTPLLLLAPTGLINGMEVVQDGDLQPGFSVINHQRRDRHVHLYRVGVVDQNDVETRYPAAVPVGDPLTAAATQKLNLANALGDVLSATSPWSPLQSSRIALPVQSNTHKTFYEIVALSPAFNQTEPAFFSEPRYAAEAPKWRAEVGDLNEAAYFELCFGLMLEALGMGGLKYTDAALTESIANVKNVGGNDVASLLARARGGDPVGSSIIAFIQLVISSDTLSSRYLAAITPIYRIANAQLAADAQLGTLKAQSLQRFRGAMRVIAIVGLVASALDIGALIHDLSDGDKANLFTADLFVPSVRLNPATSAVFSGAEVTFSASVPGVTGAALIYAWNLSGDNLAILTDSKTGKSGNTFETPGNVVTLTTSPSSQKKLTVTVEAFLPQTDGSRKSLGTASGNVTIDDQPKVLPGTFKVDIKVNGDRAGATALVTFSPVPGAKTYTLKGTGGTDPTYGSTFERTATAPVQATLGDGSVLDNAFGLSSAGGPADRDYTGAYNARFGAYTFTVTASR